MGLDTNKAEVYFKAKIKRQKAKEGFFIVVLSFDF